MDTAGRLRAIEAIQQLQARYCRLIDTKQWDDFAVVFASDVVLGVGEGATHGREAAANRIKAAAATSANVHHSHMPEIRVIDEAKASGIWAMYDWYLDGAGDESERRGFEGFGHYIQTYRFEDGAWRIATSRIERLFPVEPIGAGLPAFMQG